MFTYITRHMGTIWYNFATIHCSMPCKNIPKDMTEKFRDITMTSPGDRIES